MDIIVRNLKQLSRFCQKVKYTSSTNNCNTYLRQYSSKRSAIFSTSIPEFENRSDIKSYEDLYKFSLAEPDQFWGTLARSRLRWFKDFSIVQQCDLVKGNIAWFQGGKLNISGEKIEHSHIYLILY